MKKMGIFGGTFNPPHIGHVRAASTLMRVLHLDSLTVIPTFIPPHKERQSDDSPKARLEMCRLSFEGEDDRISVSDYEIKQGGKSYTYLTLEHFSEEGRELTFLCGTDMFLSLDTWKNPQTIFSLSKIALIRREHTDYRTELLISAKMKEYTKKYSAKIVEIRTSPYEISSTEIRQAYKAGRKKVNGVQPRVEDYIISNKLYK